MKRLLIIGMLISVSIPLKEGIGVPREVLRELRLIDDTIEWCTDEGIRRDMRVRKYKLIETFLCTN